MLARRLKLRVLTSMKAIMEVIEVLDNEGSDGSPQSVSSENGEMNRSSSSSSTGTSSSSSLTSSKHKQQQGKQEISSSSSKPAAHLEIDIDRVPSLTTNSTIVNSTITARSTLDDSYVMCLYISCPFSPPFALLFLILLGTAYNVHALLIMYRRSPILPVRVDLINLGYKPNRPGRKKQPQILQNITTCLKSGTFVAVMGPSGSGKSTLMRIIHGDQRYLRSMKGEALVNGTSIKSIHESWR